MGCFAKEKSVVQENVNCYILYSEIYSYLLNRRVILVECFFQDLFLYLLIIFAIELKCKSFFKEEKSKCYV